MEMFSNKIDLDYKMSTHIFFQMMDVKEDYMLFSKPSSFDKPSGQVDGQNIFLFLVVQ